MAGSLPYDGSGTWPTVRTRYSHIVSITGTDCSFKHWTMIVISGNFFGRRRCVSLLMSKYMPKAIVKPVTAAINPVKIGPHGKINPILVPMTVLPVAQATPISKPLAYRSRALVTNRTGGAGSVSMGITRICFLAMPLCSKTANTCSNSRECSNVPIISNSAPTLRGRFALRNFGSV